tara:strand:+ start:292 stop:477 length:186 start_codon:yes stop_codon:yes gene_type:complete
MSSLPILWQVEVSDDQKITYDRDSAYRYAEKLQSDGRNVEIYKEGKLLTRLKSQKQYSLDV